MTSGKHVLLSIHVAGLHSLSSKTIVPLASCQYWGFEYNTSCDMCIGVQSLLIKILSCLAEVCGSLKALQLALPIKTYHHKIANSTESVVIQQSIN